MTNVAALVYFKQPWCPGCEYLERVTFNDLKVQGRLSRLLLYAFRHVEEQRRVDGLCRRLLRGGERKRRLFRLWLHGARPAWV